MMIHYLYTGGIILSILIILLLKNDLKRINERLYQNIDNKLYYKLFALICIIFIHLVWLFNVFLTNNSINNIIYGLPIYLLIPYLIIIYSNINKEEYDKLSIISKILNKIFYYIFLLYFIGIIIIIIIPNSKKKDFIDIIIKILNIHIFSKFLKK